MKNYSSLLELVKNNNGYIFTNDVVKNNIPKSYLKYAIEDGVIEKLHMVYIIHETALLIIYLYYKN